MQQKKHQLKNLCQEIGSNHLSYCAGDVTSIEDNLRAVEIAKEKFGGLDIFVANAGIEGDVKNLEDYDIDKFDQVMAVNVKGPFLGLKASIPVLTDRGGGSFIITSSIAGLSGAPQIGAYATSKHAVIGLMKSAAKECADKNIRVNTVAPTFVETPMVKKFFKNKDFKKLALGNIPMGKAAKESDVATAVCFLASDAAAMITGTSIKIDGGWTAK